MEVENRTIVRIQDSYYKTYRGVAFKREMNVLKRKSVGCNLVEECFDDVECDICRIQNFDAEPPGIYEVMVCNESRDWETGWLDDWEYKLVPFSG